MKRPKRSELRSLAHFEVVIDHQNLSYFMTSRKLKGQQMRWAEELSRFNFTIRYRPGREGIVPDIFSRRAQDMPAEADHRYTHRETVLLWPDRMKGFAASSLSLNRLLYAPVQTRSSTPAVPAPTETHDATDTEAPAAPEVETPNLPDVIVTVPDAPNDPPRLPGPDSSPSLISLRQLWQEAKAQDTYLNDVKQSILRGD